MIPEGTHKENDCGAGNPSHFPAKHSLYFWPSGNAKQMELRSVPIRRVLSVSGRSLDGLEPHLPVCWSREKQSSPRPDWAALFHSHSARSHGFTGHWT